MLGGLSQLLDDSDLERPKFFDDERFVLVDQLSRGVHFAIQSVDQVQVVLKDLVRLVNFGSQTEFCQLHVVHLFLEVFDDLIEMSQLRNKR
jgi:hypothetical protein